MCEAESRELRMKDEAAVPELRVVAGIIWREGRVLVCQRPPGGHMPGLWEFPGGKMERGENARAALRREIGEELGIEASVGHLRWETRHRYPDRSVHLRFYDCAWKSGAAQNLGVARHAWVRPSALGDFDFLPADARLIDSLMRPGRARGSGTQPPRTRNAAGDLRAAYDACLGIAAARYENFPVASRLLPARVRPHLAAVYAFARGADDIADAVAPAGERLARLEEWEQNLLAARGGAAESDVFRALGDTMHRFDLPLRPFQDLLSAFRQDVTVSRYADYEALRDYCRRSANPVGRVVLMLHGIRDAEALRASDAICTALQIANHLQDVREDAERGVIYMPQDEMERFAVCEEDLTQAAATPPLRAFLVFQIGRTKRLFREGLPLLYRTRGALGRELRAIWRGGVAALDAISRAEWNVCAGAPVLNRRDKAGLFLAALRPIHRLESLADRRAEEELRRRYCRWLIRESRSNFSLPFLALPPEGRRALMAVYAYCRVADDIADAPGGAAARKKAVLRAWREALAGLREENPPHPIIGELAWAARKYDVPPEHLQAVCDGVGADLEEGRRFEGVAALENYCDKVASAVGLACLGIFGAQSESAKRYAVCLGRALQMTNILRDVWEDAARGRCYIPQDEMEEYGVSASDLASRKHAPRVVRLLRFQAGRARAYYERADAALRDAERAALLPARLMARIYQRLLRKMEADQFRHTDHRPSLPSRAKLHEALRCLLEP